MIDTMPTLDFSHLSTEQRLDLIGERLESIDHDMVPLAMQDANLQGGRDAFAVLSDLRRRFG